MKILISGAGVAGPTLAYWLAHYGFEPTIVEKAPALRTGGYIIDFWGAGFDIADRMGLLPELREKGYMVQEIRVVNRNGQRIAGFPVDVIAQATGGRYISLPRSELAASIFGKLEGKVETIFGDSMTRIEQTDRTVRVAFEHGPEREFDLVIGADGLHSRVRELVFGAESQFEKYLGCKVAAFEVEGYQSRDELVMVMYTEVHQQVGAVHHARQPDHVSIYVCRSRQRDRRRTWRHPELRRPCCGDASETAVGNARAYWKRWMPPTTCISIASARSAWMRGKDCGRRAA